MRVLTLAVAVLACSACAGDATGSSKGTTYTAPYAANVTEVTVSTSLTGGGTMACIYTYAMTGTLTITLDNGSGAVSGSAQISGNQVAKTHLPDTCPAKGDQATSWSPTLTGTTSDLHFDATNTATNAGFSITTTASFAGAVTGGSVVGVLTFTESGSGTPGPTTRVVQGYSASAQLVLTH